MNQPTQEDIALRAYYIWQERGGIAGIETETWLEAERELQARAKPSQPQSAPHSEGITSQASTSTIIKAPATATVPNAETAAVELQKAAARAPQVPHHTAPANKLEPAGKPPGVRHVPRGEALRTGEMKRGV